MNQETCTTRKEMYVLFTGNSNPWLYKKICKYLNIEPGCAEVKTFSDGEIQIEINENVRGKDVFVIQSICNSIPTDEQTERMQKGEDIKINSVNDNLVELLLMLDAFKRSSVKRTTAVIPYYGYARQDKKVAPRVPISAKLVADALQVAGAGRIITMDLHANQIQGFFDIPVDNLFAKPELIRIISEVIGSKNLVIVSPDTGGVVRARAFAKKFDDTDIAIIDKRRDKPNVAKAMAVIGDVKDKIAVIIDDITDTAGTICEATLALLKKGAKAVYIFVPHGVLSGPAIARIRESKIEKVVVANTIPLTKEALNCKKICQIDVSKLFGEAIIRSYRGDSVTSLFV